MLKYSLYHYFMFSVPEIIMITIFTLHLAGVLNKVVGKDSISNIILIPSFLASLIFFLSRNPSLHVFTQLTLGIILIITLATTTAYLLSKDLRMSFHAASIALSIQLITSLSSNYIALFFKPLAELTRFEFTIMAYLSYTMYIVIIFYCYKKGITLKGGVQDE